MLDEHEAFEAMRMFLIGYFEETKGTADVRLVLSDIEIQPDGGTLDPAAWEIWVRTVQKVIAARED